MSISYHKPQGLFKWALKIPIKIYNAGLGGLLGHRFILLKHMGRKSGRIYETVLEVPYFDRETGRSFVISGWSDKADWFRNIEAQPAVSVTTGGQTYKPVQRFLTSEEVLRFWPRFRRKYPIEEWMSLRLFSVGAGKGQSSAARRAALVKQVRVVSFER